MSVATGEPPAAGTAPRQAVFRKSRRRLRLGADARESVAVFGVSAAAYFALGIWTTVVKHLVVFDALSRLSHAYFVWHNDPPKLTAVGFVWPPIATLAFLPAAVVKPVATSLVALPLTSAVFAGALLALVNDLLRLVGMRRLLRYPLLVGFAVNPMIAFYATNGMAEIVYLFFLAASLSFFVRWFLERQPGALIFAGISFAAGILSRYEVVTWAVVLTVVIVLALIRQHAARVEIEGTVLAYLAPISYGVGLWLFFNWLILGNPFFWLSQQAPGATPSGRAPVVAQPVTDSIGAGALVRELLSLNWHLFPLTLVVGVTLVARFVLRRDLMALTIAVLLTLNAAFTGLIVWFSGAESYLQLRYNMRAMPIALVGVAWLFLSLRDARLKLAVWAGTLVLLLAGLPLTWRTMETYRFQYLEQAFTRVLATGADQEGTSSLGGYGVGIAEQRAMAAAVLAHATTANSVLTDDAQTFSIMLLSGRPDLFFDRIDRGDVEWAGAVERPFGRVRYVLVSDSPDDRIRGMRPRLTRGEEPGFTLVERIGGMQLYRVAEQAPAAP